MANRDSWFMLALFIVTFSLRIFLAFQTPHFTDDNSYFWKRQAHTILTTGKPLSHDPLSLGGRDLLFQPLFAYILALAGLFGDLTISGKILLNAIASLTPLFVYLTALHLTGSRHVSLVSSLVGAITPVWIATTTSLSPIMVILPLIALMTYSYLRLEAREWTIIFLGSITILAFLHPVAIVFVIGLGIYIILAKLEGIRLRKEEPELILVATFLVIWADMLQYKKAILAHGASFIWQNIPPPILNNYFTNIDILTTITYIGLVPFAAGIFVTYRYLLRKQSLFITLIISQTIAVGALLYLRLLPPHDGFPFFGLFLSLLFGIGYQSFLSWLSQTKFGETHTFVPLTIFMLVIATSLLPSMLLHRETITSSLIGTHFEAMTWMIDHSPADTIVLSDIPEGHLLNDIAKRKTYIDSNFLLAKDSIKRYNDFHTILSTPLVSTALTNLLTNHIQFLYISPTFKKQMEPSATWISDTDCFSLLYNKTILIYQVTCSVEAP